MAHGHWKQARDNLLLGVSVRSDWIRCHHFLSQRGKCLAKSIRACAGASQLMFSIRSAHSQLPGQEEPHGPKGCGERNDGLCPLQEILSYKYHKGRTIRSFDNHSNYYHHFTTGLLCGFYGLLHWTSDTWFLYTNLAWGISSWGKVRRKKQTKTAELKKQRNSGTFLFCLWFWSVGKGKLVLVLVSFLALARQSCHERKHQHVL